MDRLRLASAIESLRAAATTLEEELLPVCDLPAIPVESTKALEEVCEALQSVVYDLGGVATPRRTGEGARSGKRASFAPMPFTAFRRGSKIGDTTELRSDSLSPGGHSTHSAFNATTRSLLSNRSASKLFVVTGEEEESDVGNFLNTVFSEKNVLRRKSTATESNMGDTQRKNSFGGFVLPTKSKGIVRMDASTASQLDTLLTTVIASPNASLSGSTTTPFSRSPRVGILAYPEAENHVEEAAATIRRDQKFDMPMVSIADHLEVVNAALSNGSGVVGCLEDLSEIPNYILEVNSPDFDIFNMLGVHEEHTMVIVTANIFLQYAFVDRLELDPVRLVNYLAMAEQLYGYERPYHNAIHAADVLYSTHMFLQQENTQAAFSDMELLVTLFSAVVHDIGHVGVSNHFLVASSHPLAILYNDSSPNENMHTALAFLVFETEPLCRFFERDENGDQLRSPEPPALTPRSTSSSCPTFVEFRSMVTELVLGTDMKFHANFTETIKECMVKGYVAEDEVLLLLKAVVHAADLSNPMKPRHIYEQWVERVLAEFWQQGDAERARQMSVTPHCDRFNAMTVPQSQVGFIQFVVSPFMDVLQSVLPSVWAERLAENLHFMKVLTNGGDNPVAAKYDISRIEARAAVKWKDPFPTSHFIRMLNASLQHVEDETKEDDNSASSEALPLVVVASDAPTFDVESIGAALGTLRQSIDEVFERTSNFLLGAQFSVSSPTSVQSTNLNGSTKAISDTNPGSVSSLSLTRKSHQLPSPGHVSISPGGMSHSKHLPGNPDESDSAVIDFPASFKGLFGVPLEECLAVIPHDKATPVATLKHQIASIWRSVTDHVAEVKHSPNKFGSSLTAPPMKHPANGLLSPLRDVRSPTDIRLSGLDSSNPSPNPSRRGSYVLQPSPTKAKKRRDTTTLDANTNGPATSAGAENRLLSPVTAKSSGSPGGYALPSLTSPTGALPPVLKTPNVQNSNGSRH